MRKFSRYRRTLMLFGAAVVLPVHTMAANISKILVVGDSLSAEYGLKKNTGWVKLLEQKISNQTPVQAVVNASISGDTTSGGLSRLPSLLTRESPDLVIIELGANDALRGLSLKASQDNLEKMVKLCEDAGAKVMLVGMQIPPNYGKQYADAFETMFLQVAKKHKTSFVPFLFEGFATNRDMFQADGIHPNETAQPIMMETVLSALQPQLKALLRPNRP